MAITGAHASVAFRIAVDAAPVQLRHREMIA
jgi:hypothetical protein